MFSVIPMLILVLAIAMCWVGGWNGARAFFSIFCNFAILFLNVVLISWGFPAVVISLLSSMLILATTIFLGSDEEKVTENAFLGSILVVAVTMTLIFVLLPHLQVQGFGDENNEDLEGLSLLIGIKFQDLMLSTMLISSLGAIAEAAIAVSAGTHELLSSSAQIDSKLIFKNGMEIGKEIIGTALNTLFFGFFGSFLGLFTWYVKLNYGFGRFINNKIFVAELFMILVGVIGVVLTVPLTTAVIQLREGYHKAK